MRAREALAAVVCVLGCSAQGETPDPADAGATLAPPSPTSTPATTTIGHLRRAPVVAALLARRGGWTTSATVAVPTDGAAPVTLAVRGGRTIRLELPTSGGTRLEDGVLVRPGPTSDVAVFAVDGGVEEARVVHGPGDAYELTIDAGDLAVAVVDGRIEVRDARGVVARSSAVIAVDAGSTTVTLEPTLTRVGAKVHVRATLPASLQYPVVVDPLWAAVAAQAQPHGAWVQLTTSEVLAVGGFSDNGLVELRAADGTWSTTGRLGTGRDSAGLVALPGGDALAVNGISVATAERFSYATKTWSAAASPPVDFTGARGVWLPSISRALFASGSSSALYDPVTNAWSAVIPSVATHYNGRSALLKNGKVLLVGGSVPSLSSAAELFDPTSKTWTATGSMLEARAMPGLVALPDGRALVTGGYDTTAFNSTSRASVELYDPTTGKFTSGPPMFERRGEHGAVLLGTGRVLVFGGGDGTARTNLTELFDPAKGTWVRSDSMVFGCKAMGAFGVGGATGTAVVSVGGVNIGGLTDAVQAWEASPNGATCTGAGQCASGQCVDGVCCDTACTEQCKACNTASAKGTCTNVSAPVAPRPACGPSYACVAGACATSCTGTGATECAPGSYCDAGKCAPKKPLGEVCAGTAECASGRCVDGVCCDSPCTDQCLACDIPGKLGTCSPVSLGVPHGARPTCAPYACVDGKCATSCATLGTCATGHYCAGGTTCVAARKDGEACGSDDVCVSKHCVDGYCCASACDGQCVACDVPGKLGACTGVDGAPHGKRASCAPYACSASTAGGGCLGSCTKDSECDGASACDAGKCVPRKDVGAACTAATQCKSGACADGVCCDRACDGQCEACDVPGSVGTCGPVKGAPHGSRPKCDAGSETCKARSCDGTKDPTRCVGFEKGVTDACKAAVCSVDRFTPASTCSGSGACVDKDTVSCRPYACSVDGCKTKCAGDADCSAGFSCRAAACVPIDGVNVCTADKLGSVSPDGRRTACSPYRCEDGIDPATAGRCRSACTTSDHCVAGFACEGGACLPVASSEASDGGCTAAGTPSRGGFGVALGALLGVLALRRRRAILAVAVSVSACSSEALDGGDVDAGVAAAAPSTAAAPPGAAEPLLATLARAKVRLGAAGVVRLGTTFSVKTGRASVWRRLGAELEVAAPTTADGATHVRAGAHEVWIAEDTAPAPAVVVTGGLAYPTDDPRGAVALTMLDDRFESFRVLATADAGDPEQTLRLGATLRHVRVRDDRLEVLDGRGDVAFVTEPAWARDAAGVTVRVHPSVRRLDDGRFRLRWSVDRRATLTAPIVVDPSWTIGTSVTTPRVGSLALLGTKVLSVDGATGSAQVWDPATGAWTATGSMTATDSLAFRVTVNATTAFSLGGVAQPKLVQRFDLTTNTWTTIGSLTVPRNDCPTYLATTLAGGKVLVAGGNTGNVTELWNGSAWVEAGAGGKLSVGRGCAALVTLASGKALLVGGSNGGGRTVLADVYDPATDTWAKTGNLTRARWFLAATALPDGRALALGDQADGSAEVWSPATNTWTAIAAPSKPKTYDPTAVTLGSGRVLAFGGAGEGSSTAEVWDPATNTWSPAGTLTGGRRNIGAVYVPAPVDKVLAVGGLSIGGEEKLVEVFEQFADGAACGSAGECKSGACVDGVCCDTACKEQCKACDLPGKVGICSVVDKLPPRGARPSCAPYVCAAGVCPTSCTTDSQCEASRYCDAGSCLAKKTGAAACTRAGECASGFCVDGRCCNVACGGSCEACDVAGSEGTCFPLASGAPHGTHTTCAPFLCKGGACATTCATSAECTAGNGCVGGKCIPKADLGAACTTTEGCLSGQCVDGVCCDGACTDQCKACNEPGAVGKCTAVTGAPRGTRASCAPYLCAAGACGTTCKLDADCAGGHLCEGGACVKARAAGEACTKDAACASGACVDGVCCDGRCDGACEACDVPGKVGTCSPVAGAPHGKRPGCDDGGGELCKAKACDGVDRKACNAFVNGATVECAGTVCRPTGYRAKAFCDGKGACALPLETSCVPYACDAKGCLTTCADDGQCAAGFRCVGAGCVAVGDVCSPDLSKVLLKGGGESLCAPYLCHGGRCADVCTTSDDCALTHRCVDKACVAVDAPPAAGEGDGGCGCATPARRPLSSGAAALLIGLLLGATVRRRPLRYHRRR